MRPYVIGCQRPSLREEEIAIEATPPISEMDRQNLQRSNRRDVACNVYPTDQNLFQFIPYIAAGSGETTELEMILAVLILIFLKFGVTFAIL